MNPIWWRIQNRDYVPAKNTDIRETWKRHGWKPKSPDLIEAYSDVQIAAIKITKQVFMVKD